ncbi:hypothetical protein KVT40_005306 [Elsinoe batatas]|uniref:Uncharacterized protein n=1 Tax=Elsinoe batatas TaxID=2601811 RepID=A0A8K0L2A9_9PEZI|nr:hypothetical protein KVT40_005306 [Elsinoe batatas]
MRRFMLPQQVPSHAATTSLTQSGNLRFYAIHDATHNTTSTCLLDLNRSSTTSRKVRSRSLTSITSHILLNSIHQDSPLYSSSTTTSRTMQGNLPYPLKLLTLQQLYAAMHKSHPHSTEVTAFYPRIEALDRIPNHAMRLSELHRIHNSLCEVRVRLEKEKMGRAVARKGMGGSKTLGGKKKNRGQGDQGGLKAGPGAEEEGFTVIAGEKGGVKRGRGFMAREESMSDVEEGEVVEGAKDSGVIYGQVAKPVPRFSGGTALVQKPSGLIPGIAPPLPQSTGGYVPGMMPPTAPRAFGIPPGPEAEHERRLQRGRQLQLLQIEVKRKELEDSRTALQKQMDDFHSALTLEKEAQQKARKEIKAQRKELEGVKMRIHEKQHAEEERMARERADLIHVQESLAEKQRLWREEKVKEEVEKGIMGRRHGVVMALLADLAEIRGWVLCDRQVDSNASGIARNMINVRQSLDGTVVFDNTEMVIGFEAYLQTKEIKSLWVETVLNLAVNIVHKVDRIHKNEEMNDEVEGMVKELVLLLEKEPLQDGQVSWFAGMI